MLQIFSSLCKIYFLLVLSKRLIRSNECVRTCKDYVTSREITTVLKIAMFGKSCWNVDTRKMLRILFSLQRVKNIFFGFIEALDSKGILNTLYKKELHQPWNALTLQLSLSLRDKWDRSLCKFVFTEATIINYLQFLRVFLVGLGN